jgi:hypothetical protein
MLGIQSENRSSSRLPEKEKNGPGYKLSQRLLLLQLGEKFALQEHTLCCGLPGRFPHSFGPFI